MDADVGVLRAQLHKERHLRVRFNPTLPSSPCETRGDRVRAALLAPIAATQKTARADGLRSPAEHKRMAALERRAMIAEEKLDRERQRFEEAEAGRKLALKDANSLREVRCF